MTAPTIGSGLFNNQGPIHKHLAQGGHGQKGEFGELWRAIQGLLGPMVAIAVEEFFAPIAAVSNGVLHSVATTNGPVTYTAANGVLNPFATGARNLVITSNADATCPTSCAVTGLNASGQAQTETIALTSGAGTGVKAWSSITSLVFTGGTGTAGTTIVGTGVVLGLKLDALIRTGSTTSLPPFREYVDHATPTAGVIDTTNNTYIPNSAPNAGHNYAVYYEYDPTKILVLCEV